jgi:hypothetical protein
LQFSKGFIEVIIGKMFEHFCAKNNVKGIISKGKCSKVSESQFVFVPSVNFSRKVDADQIDLVSEESRQPQIIKADLKTRGDISRYCGQCPLKPFNLVRRLLSQFCQFFSDQLLTIALFRD